MATLKWFVHSACHVLGYPTKEGANINGDAKNSLKVPNGTNNVGLMSENSEVMEFQMPLHYPRYAKTDYEKMEEWRLDLLLKQYGLSFKGSLDEKREYAKGAFLWPDQY
ncbi:uncharacterized protein LOC112091870 [Morus notabilis]|uniref:uncharacterized protein LOC112091868 n=1 Tax=Morus notabilis TaxID=981085 RepID=UPI000CED56CC|nr:uncharacterized protein LOC112091868 [Morus notabilis]XP_024022336.1 uncharacterized protein LOC112091870 [Morus notabilis]